MRTRQRLFSLLVLVSLLAPAGAAARDGSTRFSGAYVDPTVLAEVRDGGETTAMVVLRAEANLEQASEIQDWNARGQFVYDQLTKTAQQTQAGVRARLDQRGLDYQSFWIVNAIQVTAGEAVIDELARQPEVGQILPEPVYHLPDPQPVDEGATLQQVQGVEWGIDRINAPDVWSTFGVRGEGIVVASLDTGIQFDHPALVAQYRGNLGNGTFDHNYNWFDPLGECGDPTQGPCDPDADGHGTHTMGTMVGDDGGANQIGVAPGAKWITVRSVEQPLASGQWMLAPTDLNGENPRPDLRPHIINNSWSTEDNNPYYQATVNAWIASGIFPMFSNGNEGPNCATAGAPGEYVASYSAGAFDINNEIADFSSRGLSGFDNEIKPNIAAPGVNVRSSIPGSDYGSLEGTSMAAPHVAGTVALMWSAAPALIGDIDATRELLDLTAIDTEDLQCGGTAEDNNVYGEGRLDAFAAVDQSPRGPFGILQGTVTSDGGAPIGGATVDIVGPMTQTVVTDADGRYSTNRAVGTYAITASAYGHQPQTATGVVVSDGEVTIQDFALQPAPTHAVSGSVRDPLGQPVSGATIQILDTPLPPATTDAAGSYTFASVPEGDYTLRASSTGCLSPQSATLVVDGDETLDVTLPYFTDSFGYSCEITTDSYVEAETVLPLEGRDEATEVELPFPFPFYGQTYSTAYVSTNGFLNFLAHNTSDFNRGIPATQAPNAAIYAFWDNLWIDGAASVRTELTGSAPMREFVIEWRNGILFDGSTFPRMDFAVVLFENGDIRMHYRNIGGSNIGSAATVGIENETGTVALQYSFNEAVVTEGLAILYHAPGPNQPPQVDAGGPYSGSEGSPINLTGGASDPDDDPLTSLWTLSDGAPCTFDDPTALMTTLTCADDGDFTVTLTVDDGEHDPVSDSATVSVSNVAPTVDEPTIDPAPSDEGQSVVASTTLSDPGTLDSHTCTVDYGDGGGPQTGTVDGDTCTGPEHTYVDDDVYTVTIEVCDEDACSDNTTGHTVENVAPTIDDITTNGPVAQGQPVTVTVAASDPGVNDTLSYRFDCDDDGSYEVGPQASNTTDCPLDPAQATTTITVEVTDDNGGVTTGAVAVIQTVTLCGNYSTGSLSTPGANGCPNGSTPLVLPAATSTTFCLNSYSGAMTWSPSGSCGPNVSTHLVPDDGPLTYCRHQWTGQLRHTWNGQCGTYETPGVIPGTVESPE